MLTFSLLHPPLLRALAAAGHGSRVLIADANYPAATGAAVAAERVFLNLSPGLLDVEQVTEALLSAVPVEAACVMAPDEPPEPSIFPRFEAMLAPLVVDRLDRASFYAAARGPDLALLIATGDQRLYANLLLTIGVVRSHKEN